jgi:hypothetical protein
MKKLITILIMFFCCSAFGLKAQSVETSKDTHITTVEPTSVKLDSLTMAYIDAIYDRIGMGVPRFKMYKTENTYNLLKLDTATGRVWQVQYRLGSTESMTVAIDDSSLVWESETLKAGRFELYATNNMYQFILLDTETGRKWQVQWHTEYNKRFRERIY